ncbi:MAG: T9SS type A sorting domain-containing protein [Chitinophagales bacterium]
MNNIISTQFQKMLFQNTITSTSRSLKYSFYFFFCFFLISSLLQAETVTWQGDVNSNWNTAANWDTNTVPNADDYALIDNAAAVMPIINSNVGTVMAVELQTETTLTIAANGNLTIDGTGCGWCNGIYVKRDAVLTIAVNGSLNILNTTANGGIYNEKGSVINNGDIHIYDTTYRGIYNYTNGTNSQIMYFTNNGNLLIENTGSDGFYSEIRKDTLVLENNGVMDFKHTRSHAFYNYAYQDSSYVDIDNHGTIRVDTTGLWAIGIYNRVQQTTVGETVQLDFDNYGIIEIDSTYSYGMYNDNYKGNLNFTNQTNATIDVQNINSWGWYSYNRIADGYLPETNFDNYGTINIRNTKYGGIQNYTNGSTFNFNNYHILYVSQTGEAGMYNYANNGYAELNFVNDGTMILDTTGTLNNWYNSGLYNRARLTQEGDTTSVLTFVNNGSISIDSTSYHGLYNNADGGNLTFTNNASASIAIKNTNERGLYNYSLERSYNTNNDFVFDNYGTILITDSGQHGLFNYCDTGELDFTLYANSVLTLQDIGSDGIRNSAYNSGLLNFVNNINLGINNVNNQGFYNSTRSGATMNFTNNHTIDINTANQNGIYNDNEDGSLFFTNNSNIFIDDTFYDGFTSDSELLDSENYTAAFTLDNYGNISLNNCGDDGFRTYIYNHTATVTNHPNATIDINNCSDDGWINNCQGENGDLTFNYTANSIIDIDDIGYTGLYNYLNNGGTIHLQLNAPLNIDNCGTNGIYNELRDGSSTMNFNNNSTISIHNVGTNGIFSNNDNSNLQFNNNANAAIFINGAGGSGITNENDHGNEAFSSSFAFDNYGLIRIENTLSNGFRSHTSNINGTVTNHPNATFDISHVGEHGFYNRSYGKGQLDFLYATGSLLKIDTVGERGMYNYASDSATVNVVINEILAIDSCGTDGLRNLTRSGGTVNFTNNSTIDIDIAQAHGIINDNENGTLSFINHQNITIDDVGEDGVSNENDIYDNAYSGTFTFENRGNIAIRHAGDEGFYTHTNNMVGTFTNFSEASIDISHTGNNGWATNSYGGGQLDFVHQENATLKIDSTSSSCFYNYAAEAAIVNLTFEEELDLDSCGIEGMYNLIRSEGTVNLTNNNVLDINTVNNSGMWTNNENGTLNLLNNGTISIANVQQYNGLAAYSSTTNTDLYSTATNYTNNGAINIQDVGNHGIDSYCSGSTATFNILNNGSINIEGTTTHGIQNNSHYGSVFTFENRPNHTISLQNIGSRGVYNITNDESTVNFTNDGTIDIDNTGNVGVYNHTRDGFVNFNNSGTIDIFNADAEGGFYNYTEQQVNEYTTELTLNNTGIINIEETEGHGLMFNTANGTVNATNSQTIDVKNTLYRGLYIYNRQVNSERICQSNFTNTSTGDLILNDINEDGIYLYTYRDTTEFVNDGAITINKTGWRGVNLYSDNNNTLLYFINNGTVEIDTTGEEGWHNQARRSGAADSPPTELNIVNNGTINIDSTGHEGFQTYGERGYVHLINGVDGEIIIRNTSEFGWHSYLYKNEDTMTVNNLIENYGLIDIADTDWSGMQVYNYRADNHEFVNQSSGIIRIADTGDKGLEIENYGNSANYSPNTNFTNHGLIDIDNVPFRSIEAQNNRGNILNFTNHGTIDIFKAEEYGIFNYAYNTSTDYSPIVNFHNWGTVNIDSTGLAGIQNYCYQSEEVNFNQHAGDINISRSFDNGIVNYTLQYNRSYSPKIHFNMEGGTIAIDDITEAGMYNFAYLDTIEVNITGGTINVSNTGTSGIFNYAYDDWSALTFSNGGTINTNLTGRDGIYNYTYNNSSSDTTSLDFVNTGTINTTNSTGAGIHNFNRSGTNFTFNNSGTLNLQNAQGEGLRNLNLRHNDDYSVTFDFDNSGKIDINTTFQEGLRTNNYGGDLTFDNSGVMMVRNANREGIENVNYRDTFDFTNNGTIQVWDSKNEDIYNSALKIGPLNFTNSTCSVIQVNGKIKNHQYANFVNNGIIMTAYNGFNDNKGNFTNNGIIEGRPDEYFETYGIQNIDDQGTILDYNLLEPLTGTVGQPISNAVNDPDMIYTILGWFTDETLSTSAGTYTAGNNTFNPNLGVGEHILYVQTSDNILGCTTARPVQVTINPVMIAEEEILVTLTPSMEENLEDNAAKSAEAEDFDFNTSTELTVFPNPFTDHTNIQFQVASDDFVTIEVYGMDGRQIAVLFEGYLSAGEEQRFGFHAEGLRNGVYLVRMVTDKGEVKSLRVVLNR